MPLTTNTNRNHINPTILFDENGKAPDGQQSVVCDYFTGCSQATTQEDVDHGMCLYRNGKATGPLLTARKSDVAQVQKFAEPFGRACDRCANENDKAFDNTNQQCVCTPQCGMCAKDDYPTKPNDDLLQTTGVMCVDAKDALLGIARQADLIPGAGAVRQRTNKIQDPACGFAEPVRPHKRGGNYYDASISTVPYNEVVIVDMRVMAEKCKVLLPGEPQELVFVPTMLHYKSFSESSSGSDGLSDGMIAMIVVLVIIVFGLTVVVCVCRGCGTQFASKPLDVRVEKSVEMTNGTGHSAANGGETGEEENAGEEGTFVTGNPLTPPLQMGSSGELA